MSVLTLADIDGLTGGHVGEFDVRCPVCGPSRRSPINQRRPVLRIWRLEPGWASYACARCGEHGWTRDRTARAPDRAALARVREEAAERERISVGERLAKARWLWSSRQPITGSIAETYLREARGYRGPLPATLGYLPARDKHGPAMIAAFGLAGEPEPGLLAIADAAVRGVHITRLAPDGSGKAGTDHNKIMLGCSAGSPIVLVPINDLLGLAICEGIEDALSAYEATGLGAWAAGCASRLPALADRIPTYVDSVSVFVDDDAAGRRHANELRPTVEKCGCEVRLITPGLRRAAA